MKTHATSAACPKCGHYMHTSDVEGYAFVCYECEENFYTTEICGNLADLHELNVEMTVDNYEKHLESLQILTSRYNCDFLGFDNVDCYKGTDIGLCDIGWFPDFPDSDTLNEFCKALNALIGEDCEW